MVDNKKYNLADEIQEPYGIVKRDGYVNEYMEIVGFVSIKDNHVYQPPDFTPDHIANTYVEGSTCLSVKCWNAAAAMFRSAVDLTTKALLPAEDVADPPKHVRRSLGLRLQWLFDCGALPSDLKELAEAIQKDGNDGVHDANLTEADALDLMDFTHQLLERVYSVPGRLEQARSRRDVRRNEKLITAGQCNNE